MNYHRVKTTIYKFQFQYAGRFIDVGTLSVIVEAVIVSLARAVELLIRYAPDNGKNHASPENASDKVRLRPLHTAAFKNYLSVNDVLL